MNSSVDFEKDTHALVKFLDEEDEPTAIVPLKTIQKKETLDYGGSCKVTWSNHKSYRAFLLFSGTKDECAKKQDEVDPEESEEEDALPVKRTRNDAKGKCDGKKSKILSGEKTKKREKAKKPMKKVKKKCEENSKEEKSDFTIHIGPSPPSSSQHQGGPSSSQQQSGPSSSQHQGGPSSSQHQGGPSSSQQQGGPSSSQHQGGPSSSQHQGGPSSSQHQGGPSSSQHQGGPSSQQQSMEEDVTSEEDDSSQDILSNDDLSDDDLSAVSPKKIYKVKVRDGPANRAIAPQHRFLSSRQEMIATVDQLKKDIQRNNEEQRLWLETQFDEIKKQLNLFIASGLAKTLSPLLPSAVSTPSFSPSPLQVPVATTVALTTHGATCPVLPSPVTTPSLISPSPRPVPVVTTVALTAHGATSPVVYVNTSTTVNTCGTTNQTALAPVSVTEVPEPNMVVETEADELIPPSVMVDHFTKAKSRHHLAAILVAELIDEQTRLKSNVRGRGKEKLDPTVIEWVKKKVFQYHPAPEANKKDEWERCIQAIDGKNRAIKRRLSRKPQE